MFPVPEMEAEIKRLRARERVLFQRNQELIDYVRDFKLVNQAEFNRLHTEICRLNSVDDFFLKPKPAN